MTFKERKNLLTGKSLRHQLNKRFSVAYPKNRSFMFRMKSEYSPVMRPDLEDENVIRKKPRYDSNAPLIQQPMQFSKGNKLGEHKLIGREIADYALDLINDIGLDLVPSGYRQVMKGDEVHSIKSYQIINFDGSITKDNIKDIAKICDESWRI